MSVKVDPVEISTEPRTDLEMHYQDMSEGNSHVIRYLLHISIPPGPQLIRFKKTTAYGEAPVKDFRLFMPYTHLTTYAYKYGGNTYFSLNGVHNSWNPISEDRMVYRGILPNGTCMYAGDSPGYRTTEEDDLQPAFQLASDFFFGGFNLDNGLGNKKFYYNFARHIGRTDRALISIFKAWEKMSEEELRSVSFGKPYRMYPHSREELVRIQ